MLAIDTNVVVRYLTGDHPRQSARARRLVDGSDVFISSTVMLETEWVLRAVYHFEPIDICRALRAFSGLPGISVEDPALVAVAIDRAEQGMDFADALHLGKAGHCEAMLTFDRDYIATANAAGVDTVREL